MTPTLPRTPEELTALLDAVEARVRRHALADGMDVQRKAFADALALLSPIVKAFDPSEKRDGSGKWTAGGGDPPDADPTPKPGETLHFEHVNRLLGGLATNLRKTAKGGGDLDEWRADAQTRVRAKYAGAWQRASARFDADFGAGWRGTPEGKAVRAAIAAAADGAAETVHWMTEEAKGGRWAHVAETAGGHDAAAHQSRIMDAVAALRDAQVKAGNGPRHSGWRYFKGFDPSEKRGGDGRWAAGGGSGVSPDTPAHPDPAAPGRDLAAGLAEKLPPGVWDQVGDKVLTAAAHVYGAMLRATPAALKAMHWFEELGDTPHDLTRLGYAPATAGTASAAATARMDPVRGATGGLVSTHVAATVASHLLGRAYVAAKKRLGGQRKAYTDGYAEAGALVAEMLGAVHDALGLDPAGVPTPEAIAAALRGQGGAVEKAHRRRLVLKAVTHAPKGGATVNGKEYAGGEFIPASEMAKASDEEKAALGIEDGEDEEEEPDPLPEWDGDIDADEVEADKLRHANVIADWISQDGYDHYENEVLLQTGEYNPFPDHPDSEPVDVWRWVSRDQEGDITHEGDWTTDRAEAEADGKRHARDNDDPPQEDEDDTPAVDLGSVSPPKKRDVTVGPEKLKKSEAGWSVPNGLVAADPIVYALFGTADDDEAYTNGLVAAIGMPDDAEVEVTDAGRYEPLYSDDPPIPGAVGVRVKVSHPKMGRVFRFVGFDADGLRFIKNEIIEIKPEFQGEGMGADIFARQVEAAASSGFDYVVTHAARSGTMNGYATWPKFGYDQAFDDDTVTDPDDKKVFAEAKRLFPQANSVLDLFDTQEGEEWWSGKKNPDGTRTPGHGTDLYNARFDLDPDSRSMARLRAYAHKKRAAKAGAETKSFSPRNRKTTSPRRANGSVRKAWESSDHPRDDHGRFVSKDELAAARTDPKKAAELRARVTDPGQRAKLDAHIGGGGKPARGPAAGMSNAEFDAAVMAGHKTAPTGRFGHNKVFISHLHDHLARTDPRFAGMPLDEFKRRLVASHGRADGLTLSRADMAEIFAPADMDASEAKRLNAQFHFVTDEKAGATAGGAAAPDRPTPHDPVSASLDAIKGHAAGTAPDRHKKIADLLAGHTVEELHRIKRLLRLAASGNKADLVNKISLRAAGMSVPAEGYTGRLRTRDGKTQLWQRGRLLGTIDDANPSAGGRERVPVEHAHDRIRAMHADGTLHTAGGRLALADMMTHQMTIPDLHELKRRLGLKASGRKAELVRKLTERAGGAVRREDALEAAARDRDLADAMARREPADTFRTDAHAQEADEAAADKRDRMSAWANDKPGSVAAEEAARRAQGRVDAGRDAGVTPKPVEPQPLAQPKPAPDGLVEMTDAEMAAEQARAAEYERRQAATPKPAPAPPLPARPSIDENARVGGPGYDGMPDPNPLTLAGIRDAQSRERAGAVPDKPQQPAPPSIAPVNVRDFDSVRPVDLATGEYGEKAGGGEHQIPHGGAAVLRTSPFREPVVRVPYHAGGEASFRDIPEGAFGKILKDMRAAGVPTAELPAALAAGHGTGKKSAERVADYLAGKGGGGDPPAEPSAAPDPDEPADWKAAMAATKRHRETVLEPLRERMEAARAKFPPEPTRLQVEHGATHTPPPPEVQKEYDDAKAAHAAAATEAKRLYDRMNALINAGKTRPPTAAKKKPPAGRQPGQAELLRMSNAELADRGYVRTSGPRGPYVRRGTPEELNDHY